MKENTQNNSPGTGRRKLSALKIALAVIYAIGAITIVCILTFLLFPDPIVNRYVKPVIIKAIADAYPEYSIGIAKVDYNVVKNRIGCDSVAMSAVDGSFSFTVRRFSVSGIGWFHLLLGGNLAPDDADDVVVDAHDILVKFPLTQYELRCDRVFVSVPDSEMTIEDVKLDPAGDDEQFFESSLFRRTRLRIAVPHIAITGTAYRELLQGEKILVRSVRISEPLLDILVNNDKKSPKDTPGPMMPNEILSSIKKKFRIDDVRISNAQVEYGEREAVGSKTAGISFDSVQLMADGIANHGDSHEDIVIHAKGIFMKSGRMNVVMSIPVSSPECSFRYYGTLGSMDISALNTFLETAEQVHIKGALQEATFTIDVVSGRASGTVRALYKNVIFASTDKNGSEKKLSDRIISFVANVFKIRGSNMPDASGSIAVGKVAYVRKPDDPFFRFVWFALRSGVKDVVGF